MSVYENYLRITDEISEFATKYGRNSDEIKLLTVSKSQNISDIAELASNGVCLFGESRVQEALPKMDILGKELVFHFIGNVQTNKIKKMIGRFALIHSIDRLDALLATDKAATTAGIRQDILIQLNLAREVQKGGVYEEELDTLAEYAENCENVRLRGFMIIQPYEDTKRHVSEYFRRARNIFEKFSRQNKNIDILSMGMSGDMEEAVAEGSTMLRIGSAIFKR